jgi:hypothetical protein
MARSWTTVSSDERALCIDKLTPCCNGVVIGQKDISRLMTNRLLPSADSATEKYYIAAVPRSSVLQPALPKSFLSVSLTNVLLLGPRAS